MHKCHPSNFNRLYKFRLCFIRMVKKTGWNPVQFHQIPSLISYKIYSISSDSLPVQSSPLALPLRMEMHMASWHDWQRKFLCRLRHTVLHAAKWSMVPVPVPTVLPYPLQKNDSAVSHTAFHPAIRPQLLRHQSCGHSCYPCTAALPPAYQRKNPYNIHDG